MQTITHTEVRSTTIWAGLAKAEEPVLLPAPLRWRDFPIRLVRLLEETYDIVSDGGSKYPEWEEVFDQMCRWMPGLGIEPWDYYEIPGFKRMQKHIREYRDAGMPWEGVEPHGLKKTPISSNHCIHGHELTGENLYLRANGRKECRTCRSSRETRWRKGEAA